MVSATLNPEVLKTLGIYLVCLVISIGVHEYFHALFAHWLGDRTPEQEGRLTMNPIVHADPIGTFTMPIIASLTGMPLLGWGRPVPTQPQNYTRRVSMRTGLAIVAAAGPLGNLVVALVTLLLAFVLNVSGMLNQGLAEILITLLLLNIVLMVFNLLPLHPLDGGKILAAFLPPRLEYVDEFLMQYGGYILILLVVAGGPVLGTIVAPFMKAAAFLWQLVVF